MAELIAQVKIDGFECVEDMAQAVLSWTYKGKTIKEWADSISEPKTNADRIRSMTDEELAEWFYFSSLGFHYNQEEMLNWLKQGASE